MCLKQIIFWTRLISRFTNYVLYIHSLSEFNIQLKTLTYWKLTSLKSRSKFKNKVELFKIFTGKVVPLVSA